MEQTPQQNSPQCIIRISDNRLDFATRTTSGEIMFTPCNCRSGISIAANLREAFRNDTSLLNNAGTKVTVIIDSPSMLIPLEEYQSEDIAEMYHYTFPGCTGKQVTTCVLPSFKDVCAFSIDKDLMTVLSDNFEEVRVQPVMLCVWEFLMQRSVGSNNKKLFVYFHDNKLEICSFNRNRFAFCNTFEIKDMHDAIFFILGVWKQIGGNVLSDDLFFMGRIAQREQFTNEMKKYLRRVYYINPTADFNRAPVTNILNMPFDMMLAMV